MKGIRAIVESPMGAGMQGRFARLRRPEFPPPTRRQSDRSKQTDARSD